MIIFGLLFGFFTAAFCWGVNGRLEARAKTGFLKIGTDPVQKMFKKGRGFRMARRVLYSTIPVSFFCGVYFEDIKMRYALGPTIAVLFVSYCLIFTLAVFNLHKKDDLK